jgi:ferrochelatase
MPNTKSKVGVLLVNLGTPEAPTPSALRRYLAEFLWDPRVVEIPRPIWWLILHGIVLRLRPRRAAEAYRSIWMEKGSPLLVLTEELAETVRGELNSVAAGEMVVDIAMRYGRPSVGAQLERLKAAGVQRILVLPLYPQYAAATTASVFDAVAAKLRQWRHVPELGFVSDYHDDAGYVGAVSTCIEQFWKANGKSRLLLFSFHGLPERCRLLGDPYYDQCLESAGLLAQRMGLEQGSWRVVFQSRFGRAEWLKPYCVDVLKALPGEGIKTVDVVCPGFAVDCLETLEEIAIANREVFLGAGGERYRYIPALNSSPHHARALGDLIRRRLGEAGSG